MGNSKCCFKEDPEEKVQTSTFKISNNVKSNVVRVWQKIHEHKDSKIKMLKYELFSIATLIYGMFNFGLLLAMLILVLVDTKVCYRFFIDEKVVVIVALITMLYIRTKYKQIQRQKKGLTMGFEYVKDLVRGTIVAEISQLWEAYEHFSKLKGVEIFEIKSLKKVEMLQNITVLFVYQEKFIGEMQIRFGEKPHNYEANHFIYEIARSEMTLEIL